ncbi:MAG: (Fe-S)-binding protein [Anaerolineales bacterium]
MLTPVERVVFIAMVVIFVGILTTIGFLGILLILRSGRAAPRLRKIIPRSVVAFLEVGLQRPMLRDRPILTTFHAFIFFGFSYYLLVNLADLIEGFVPGFELIYGGQSAADVFPVLQPAVDLGLFNIFNLVADVLSVLTLLGMAVFLLRRFVATDHRLRFNSTVLLHKSVAGGGIRIDSAIVGGFILLHVGSRFTGQALRLARGGAPDPFMPAASLVSKLFSGLPEATLTFGIHVTWWLAIGLIAAFFPYFVRSKHIHLMVAPLNLSLRKQTPRGTLDPAFANGSAPTDLPGATTLQELPWPRLLDAYACIMCNRCQDVCPAHGQGQALSPAALEINKRYMLNEEFFSLARGGRSDRLLTEYAISPEAVWACTTCFACVRVCPVGNEPMADIIDIRRRMVYEGEGIDTGVQTALESLAMNGNWFGRGKRARAKWTKALDFKIKDTAKEPVEFLWFVGDTAAFDERVVPLTQKLANVLHATGVDVGILYAAERNAGNDVRRAGEEGLFEQLVEENLETFGKSQFDKIMTTDPHSLNALRNEYPQYGGMWSVHHYTEILLELVEQGRLVLEHPLSKYWGTYHDPCYLGRYNGGYEAPRKLVQLLGLNFVEMPRNRENSYCCGAGGGRIWMAKTPEGERPAENRIREALAALEPAANGDEKLLFIVACPKDVVMYADAVKTTGSEDNIVVRDIIELIEESAGLELNTLESVPAEALA